MTDTYTPANWSQGYGWGQGYPNPYGTAPPIMPSPSTLPAYGAAGVTAANGGVPPGTQAQEGLQALGPSAAAPVAGNSGYGPPTAPQQAPGTRFTPQQLQMLQYFLGGNRGNPQSTQQMLMQLLQQRAQGGQQSIGTPGMNLNNPFLQAILQQHMAAQVPPPSP